MNRLLPYQDIEPHTTIGLFANLNSNTSIVNTGNGDAGLFVQVASGDLDKAIPYMTNDTYLGWGGNANVGTIQYPVSPLKVTVASANSNSVVGLTLKETVQQDENGEKLNYYTRKRDDLNVATPGQTIPLATKGLVTLSYHAFGDGANLTYVGTPGQKLVIGASAGRVTGVAFSSLTGAGALRQIVGTVLATGTRIASDYGSDYYVGASRTTGAYAIVKLDI